ncbi:hypothetical protein [Telluribacter sp. SYSU D00476]|uniref:hypothetical protein n=1 Tax=Telluribacter sp. SYSU D00476 TaxID=2811430 RepID=UPI001FF2A6FB|nr:hypothetical protein [Telluribacter sp. SYSU D00476]
MKSISLKGFFLSILGMVLAVPVYACTIFVLTDAERTLFFNNEDYSNPATRIWFLPGGKGYYGMAYVGFDNDWAQGGVNTVGLAFDWVAGVNEQYVPAPHLLKLRGNPSERMLESCATVEEAIAFYQKYQEPSFSYARIMIADKSGASVIIGARNGQLYFARSNQSRGFGYGEKALKEHLTKAPQPTVQGGLPILQACLQQGQYATKYSSIYDLRSGDIYLVPPGDQQAEIRLNMSTELAKGGHYYDMPQLTNQLNGAPLALRPGMKRFLHDGYTPVPDPDPAIDQRFRSLFENNATGALKAEEFSPELWQQIAPSIKDIQEEAKKLGRIESFTLLERKETDQQRSFLYLIEYENFTILQRFVLNDKNQLTVVKSEGWEQKSK